MAIWNGEPHPGFFDDLCGGGFLTRKNEAFIPDSKWVLNRKEEDNSPMSAFAEFNAAVLGIIHTEKRFPTKDELEQINPDGFKSTVENLWGDLTTWDGASSCDTINIVAEGTTTCNFTVHLNGVTTADFKEPLPQSALLSTKGCNKYNTSEKFLNEIKNYE